MAAPFIIASEHNGLYRVMAFDRVPTVAPGLIFIEGAPGAEGEVALLESELTWLKASGPGVRFAKPRSARRIPASLPSFDEPSRQKLLVLVCGAVPVPNRAWFDPGCRRSRTVR